LVVYDVEGLHGGDISAEELDATPQATLDGETTARIFRQATWKAGEPWWKGGSLGVASLDDGTKRQIAISYYGGIFVVLGEPGYYVIEGESRVAFDVVMKEILAKTFLPSREKGLGRSEFGTK